MVTSDVRKVGSRLLILMILVTLLTLLTRSSRAFFFSAEDILPGSAGVRPTSQIQQNSPIKVSVDNLPADNGLIPVEIQQVQVSSSDPSQIESVSYLVRNNTNKKITAFSVARSITYEENGAEYAAISNDTAEFELHPDFNKTSKVKSLPQGAIEPIESSGAVSFGDDTIIKEVRLRIDYVQFDDGSIIGPGSEGERHVKLAREGASKYKAWLKDQFVRSGKSLTTVLTLLQNDEIPEELAITDSDRLLGARNYRLRLLKIFQTYGPDKVKTYLNH